MTQPEKWYSSTRCTQQKKRTVLNLAAKKATHRSMTAMVYHSSSSSPLIATKQDNDNRSCCSLCTSALSGCIPSLLEQQIATSRRGQSIMGNFQGPLTCIRPIMTTSFLTRTSTVILRCDLSTPSPSKP